MAILFVFNGLNFRIESVERIYNIFTVKRAPVTTYILFPKAPRGAFYAMISNYPSVPGIVATDVDQVRHNFKGTTKI